MSIGGVQRLETCDCYQAVAREVAGLISTEPEVFAPSEELTVLKIMEGFTSMMSKHIQDVSAYNSGTVDYRTWITEDSDNIDACFDDAWKTYFEKWHYSLPVMQSSFDCNVLHEGAVEVPNLSQDCTDMTELLYRCPPIDGKLFYLICRRPCNSRTSGILYMDISISKDIVCLHSPQLSEYEV